MCRGKDGHNNLGVIHLNSTAEIMRGWTNCPFSHNTLPRMKARCNCREPKENSILRKRTKVGVYKDTGQCVCEWRVAGKDHGDRRIKRGVCMVKPKVSVKNQCTFSYSAFLLVFQTCFFQPLLSLLTLTVPGKRVLVKFYQVV